jgi:hypothetical protein
VEFFQFRFWLSELFACLTRYSGSSVLTRHRYAHDKSHPVELEGT